MVSEKTIKALHFDKVLHAVGKLCIAEDSAKVLVSRYPLTRVDEVFKEHMQYNSIAFAMENLKALSKVAAIPSCIHLINAPQSKVYTIEELVLLRNALDTMHRCAQWVDDVLSLDEPFKIKFSSSLIPLALLKTLQKFFDEQGRIRTDNIPGLCELERKRLRIQKKRSKIAQEFLRSNSDICASATPTLRDDRIVLLIRSSHKSHITGIVHASSAREKSTYIEIPELYELNNTSLQLREEEHALYYKLCLTLSEQVAKLSHKLYSCYEAFMSFDLLYARYTYGRMSKGVLVSITQAHERVSQRKKNTEGARQELGYYLHLHNATNPFVSQCSPLTFTFDATIRQLVLSGPNAGGKTVALKTLGLCALMNQSTIPLPLRTADASLCTLPVFENINAVIGDAQDVEAGLSTFSSHLRQIHNAIQDAHTASSSLLLFDELCADTDDREGAALACALLEYLVKTNSTLCITTHSALVKHYVLTKAQSQACLAALIVTSDENPNRSKSDLTYRIKYNAIGTSEAIRIAQRIGMPHEILTSYQAFLQSFGNDYNAMLQALESSYAKAETLRKELKSEKQKYIERMQTLQEAEQEREREKKKNAHEVFASGTALLNTMRKKLERLSEMIARVEASSSDETQLSHDELHHLSYCVRLQRSDVRAFEEDLTSLRKTAHDMRELQEGDSVIILTNGAKATVLSRSKNKQQYRVQAGVFTLTLARHQLQAMNEDPRDNTVLSHSFSLDTTPLSLPSSLDVRGCTAEEATEQLHTYIDALLLQKRKHFSVIHGKGTGVLMREIHRMLKRHPLVASTQYADEYDGGVGKTYVQLR